MRSELGMSANSHGRPWANGLLTRTFIFDNSSSLIECFHRLASQFLRVRRQGLDETSRSTIELWPRLLEPPGLEPGTSCSSGM